MTLFINGLDQTVEIADKESVELLKKQLGARHKLIRTTDIRGNGIIINRDHISMIVDDKEDK